MQICKGKFSTCKENVLALHGVTPAEVLIFKTMHMKNSDGSPLADLEQLPGYAKTITRPFKNSVPQSFNIITGTTREAQEAIPEESHVRTNGEEIERLKRKYTGRVQAPNGAFMSGFEATFGVGARIQLPTTFDEIAEDLKPLGVVVKMLPVEAISEEPIPSEPAPAPAPEPVPPSDRKPGWKVAQENRAARRLEQAAQAAQAVPA